MTAVKRSAANMEQFKTNLLALMTKHNVRVDVGYGEYDYNGIDFVWFVDMSIADEYRRTDSCVDVVDLPNTDDEKYM